MKAFYEKHRDDENRIVAFKANSLLFPPHFHENVEIFIALKGEYKIKINETQYKVSENELLFIDSYCIHSYNEKSDTNEIKYVILIPPKYLAKYNSLKGTKKLTCPLIKDAKLCEEIIKIYDSYLLTDNEQVKAAAIDLIFAFLSDKLVFRDNAEEHESPLIRKMLVYAQENYRNNASIEDFSRKYGYSKEHLSRIFHKYFKIGFPEYVNTLRFYYIQEQLAKDASQKITMLLFDAGFKSIQSYYRFKSEKLKK